MGTDCGLKEYLEQEWKYNNIKKYQQYFEIWYNNLTPTQIQYYNAYSRGLKTPW